MIRRSGYQISVEQILHSVQLGNCCRVLGPRYRSKSKIMQKAVSDLQALGTHYASYQSLRDVQSTDAPYFYASLSRDVPLIHESDFFAGLYDAVVAELKPMHSTYGQNRPRSAFEFQIKLLQIINQSDRNIALFIDDLEMVPPNLVAALLGVLQAVYMTVIDQRGAYFQAIVCGSLSFSQLTLNSASHFESISDLVLITDLDEVERETVARYLLAEAGLDYGETAVSALLGYTQGDRHLIECVINNCVEEMDESKYMTVTPPRIADAVDCFLRQPPTSNIHETLQQIQSDPDLLSCTLKILHQGQVPSAQLPISSNETPNPLDLSGIFSKEKEHYKIKCPLWKDLLEKHLDAVKIGQQYAIAGYWHEAINYLSQAIQEKRSEGHSELFRDGRADIQSELFAVIINAIHASVETAQAYRHLAQGLQGIYPNQTLRLYQRDELALHLVYPPHLSKKILLNEIDKPEIEALSGPDYSLSSDGEETFLFIPLRVGHVQLKRPLGLAAFGGLAKAGSSYRDRQTVLQLVSFLHQAARAILRATLHEQDIQRRALSDKISKIASQINANLDMEMVYEAILAQVTKAIPHADNACIVELNEATETLSILAVSARFYDAIGWYADEPIEVDINGRTGIVGQAIRSMQPIRANDVRDYSDYISAIPTTQSELCIPIQSEGSTPFAIVLESNKRHIFTQDDIHLLQMLAEHIAITVKNATQFKAARERQLLEQTAMITTGLIHDINNVVASIPGTVDELEGYLRSDRDISGPLEDLKFFAKETARVSKRIRDFVVTEQLEEKLVDLEQLIHKAIEISNAQKPPYIQTKPKMNGLKLKVFVDRLWIELMLKNLLINAYDSIKPDQDGLVIIDVDVDQNHIFISIQDNGKGISQEITSQIFELGYSTRAQKHGPNIHMHGIGLFHCRQIVQAHDGTITVKSELGNGSEFIVSLPRPKLSDSNKESTQ